jgi:phosphatidylinositol 3-kinase
MSEENKMLIWRFRYSQKKNKKALSKLLVSVKWTSAQESAEAIDLMHDWEKIDLEQALTLISGQFSLNDEYSQLRIVNPCPPEIGRRFRKIRALAIKCLEEQTMSRLDLISLQLVQALKYEDIGGNDSPLRDFLIDKAIESEELAHSLHWHLELERNNRSNLPHTKAFYNATWEILMSDLEKYVPELWQGIQQGVEFKNRMHQMSCAIK